MREISPCLMRFLVAGCLTSALLLLAAPSLKVAFLLAIAIWSFARAHYLAIHVLERYIDGEFRFSGLWALARTAGSKRSA